MFTKTIYKNHFYGHSYTFILEQIDNVSFEDIKKAYSDILENSKKTLSLVGDIDLAYDILNNNPNVSRDEFFRLREEISDKR